MTVDVSLETSFVKALKSLPPHRQKKAVNAIDKFGKTPNLSSLRLRSLENKDGYWLIDAARGDRIVLREDGGDLYAAVDVGPHDNVYRRWNRR